MAGRKPLTTAHVDHLDGSERAKERLRTFLETLGGTLAIPAACERLGLHESHFHELRREWLQAALERLEPRPMGRPRRRVELAPLVAENSRLEQEVAELREQLRATQTRGEIDLILVAAQGAPGKKTTGPRTLRPKPR